MHPFPDDGPMECFIQMLANATTAPETLPEHYPPVFMASLQAMAKRSQLPWIQFQVDALHSIWAGHAAPPGTLVHLLDKRSPVEYLLPE